MYSLLLLLTGFRCACTVVHFVCSCHCSIGDDDVHRMNCVPQSTAASPDDGNGLMTSSAFFQA